MWNFPWRRGLFAWDDLQVSQLLDVILSSYPSVEFEEKWVWKDVESEVFSVKSTYTVLKGETEGENSRLYNFFWKTKVLPSTQVTTLRVVENKIASKANLERRGVELMNNLCCLCGTSVETTSHIFVGCRVSWLVWNLCSP